MITKPARAHVALALILALAFAWRLINIGFGLPGMYDPDEPNFMLKALELLDKGTLNPGWFGHPGSTTIYLLALIDIAVVLFGLATGQYANVADFAAAAFANPTMLFLPSRLAMVVIGVLCVWLSFIVGRRLFGTAAGLLGAALLAFNPLHIEWSQIIRTDIHASLFMLASLFFSLRVADNGRARDYLLAGMFVGFAAATKWPATSIAVALVGAALHRSVTLPGSARRELSLLAAAMAASIAGLFVASPYILIDWRTVLDHVSGEAVPFHLGHTGGSFFDNLGWYLREQIAGSMGILGLGLALGGTLLAVVRHPVARSTIVPAGVAFLALICSQSLIWSRWVLPVVPMACILAAAAAIAIARPIANRLAPDRRSLVFALIASAAVAPSLVGAWAGAVERSNDTRGQASDWARAHIPPGSTVVLEHLALELRNEPWTILFPIGSAGCIDGKRALETGVEFDAIEKLRGDSPIVDIGNVDRLESCRADYAILTYFDLYLLEADRFPAELATYRRLLSGGRTVALFRPQAGTANGPVVRIVALGPQSRTPPQ